MCFVSGLRSIDQGAGQLTDDGRVSLRDRRNSLRSGDGWGSWGSVLRRGRSSGGSLDLTVTDLGDGLNLSSDSSSQGNDGESDTHVGGGRVWWLGEYVER